MRIAAAFAATLLAVLLAAGPVAAAVRPTYFAGEMGVGLPFEPHARLPSDALDPVDLLLLGAYHATPLVAGPGGLSPGLLAEVPEPQAGGRAFRLVLKPDLRFADGAPLEAADLAASLGRLAQPGAPHGWIALPIQGASAALEVNHAISAAPMLPGIQVLSDREVLVTLAFPLPDWPAALATIPAALVSPRGVGAGPFVADGVVRSKDFWIAKANEHCAQGRPFVERLSASAIDPRRAARQLEASKPDGGLALVLRPEAIGPRATALPARTATYAAIGAARLGPGADAVRWVLRAVDRSELARLYVPGPSEPLAALLPSAVLGAVAVPAPPPLGLAPRRAVAPARLALLVLSTSAEQRAVASRIQVKLFDRGIQAAIETAEPDRFWPRVASGDYDVALVPVPVLATRPAVAAGEVAWALRGPKAARRAMERLALLPPEAIGRALDALTRDLDAVPLFASGLHASAAPSLQGLAPRPDGTIDFGELWIWPGGTQ